VQHPACAASNAQLWQAWEEATMAKVIPMVIGCFSVLVWAAAELVWL